MACDPNFSQVSLLLHCDGTNGSTSFPDSSSVGNVMTAAGTAAVTTTNPAFGTGSLLVTGNSVSGNDISTPITTNGPLDLVTATVDFTIEFLVYLNDPTHPYASLMTAGYSFGNGWELDIEPNGVNITLVARFGTTFLFANVPITNFPTQVWTAVAFVRQGNVFGLWIGGTAENFVTYTGSMGSPGSTLLIGAGPGVNASENIQFDEIRITKGFARYTPGTSYSQQTAAFPNGACAVVPNVVGDVLAVGEAAIIAAGLTVGTVTPGTSQTVPYGDIISQNPVGGTQEITGFPVNLVWSVGDTFTAPVLSGSIPNPTTQPNVGVLTWTQSLAGSIPATGYDIYRNGVSIATVGAVLTYTDTVPLLGTYTYNVAAYDSTMPGDVSPLSNTVPLNYAGPVYAFINTVFDEAIFGAYFGGQLNLVEFTYMPGRTPFVEGATNLIINRYKQEPGDVRARGVDFTQFVVPGELLQAVSVESISAQGVPQQLTNPLVTPLVVSNLVIDPVTNLIFGYTVSGGQNGIEYTIQFETTTNIQTTMLEEIFSINILVEDSFP